MGALINLTVFEEFQSAIRVAADEAGPKETSREAAIRFYKDHADFTLGLGEQWIIEKLWALIAKHRLKARREVDPQYQLGLGRVPRKSSSVRAKRSAATISTIGGPASFASQLRKVQHPALLEVEQAMVLMAKYTEKGKGKTRASRGERVREKEAAKLANPAPLPMIRQPGNWPTEAGST